MFDLSMLKGLMATSDLDPEIESLFAIVYAVGSRFTCDPPPMDTDKDFLCLATTDKSAELIALGFSQDGSPEFYTGNDNGGFRSFRKGEVNLIVTQDPEFFDLFWTATRLAKNFNLLEKRQRIALFQAVLYGVKSHNLKI